MCTFKIKTFYVSEHKEKLKTWGNISNLLHEEKWEKGKESVYENHSVLQMNSRHKWGF